MPVKKHLIIISLFLTTAIFTEKHQKPVQIHPLFLNFTREMLTADNAPEIARQLEDKITQKVAQSSYGIYTEKDRKALNWQFLTLKNELHWLCQKYAIKPCLSNILSTTDSITTPRNADAVLWKIQFLKADFSVDYAAIEKEIKKIENQYCHYFNTIKTSPNYLEVMSSLDQRELYLLDELLNDSIFGEAYYTMLAIENTRLNFNVPSLFFTYLPTQAIKQWQAYFDQKNIFPAFEKPQETAFAEELRSDTKRFCLAIEND